MCGNPAIAKTQIIQQIEHKMIKLIASTLTSGVGGKPWLKGRCKMHRHSKCQTMVFKKLTDSSQQLQIF